MEKRRLPKSLRLKAALRHNLPVTVVYLVLRLIVIVSLVSALLRKQYESAFLCVLVLVLFLLPMFIERNFRIHLPDTLEIIILLFIFAAEILGELQCYFIQYPHWDTMDAALTGAPCFARIDLMRTIV